MLDSMIGRGAATFLLGTVVLGAGACAAPANTSAGPAVVTSVYPFQYAAERVLGDLGSVTSLTAPGSDSHDLELSPRQVEAVGAATLMVYQSGFQAAVDDVVDQQSPAAIVDASTFLKLRDLTGDPADEAGAGDGDHAGETLDPHTWLDPTNLATVGTRIGEALAGADPANADTYRANAEQLAADLSALDEEFSAGLANCATDTIITNHEAFGYLTDRYGLEQVGISLSPDAEPSPARLAEVERAAGEHQVTTIFYETTVSPKVAQVIADDLGLATDMLDPLESLSDQARGSDYLEVMRANLAALQQANGCR